MEAPGEGSAVRVAVERDMTELGKCRRVILSSLPK